MKSWLAASGAQTEALAGAGIEPEGPMRHYVGLLEGEPVGASSLMLAAGVASLPACGDGTPSAPAGRWDGDVAGAECWTGGHWGYRIGIPGVVALGFRGVQPGLVFGSTSGGRCTSRCEGPEAVVRIRSQP